MAKQKVITQDERKEARRNLRNIGDGKIGRDIFHMVKSRYRILYIRTHEEVRVVDYFRNLAIADSYDLFMWDCSRGLRDGLSSEKVVVDDSEVHESPIAILSHIIDHANSDYEKINSKTSINDGHIYLLLDFHPFLEGTPQIERKLKEFSQMVSVCVIVIVSPVFQCPPALEKEFTLIDFPYPSKTEIENSLNKIIPEIPPEYPEATDFAKNNKEDIINSVKGLTLVEAENAFAKTLVKDKNFNIQTILEEKKQVIRKSGILEYRESKFSMDDIGGIDVLKDWLSMRRLAFKEDALQFGLPCPKGVLLVGVPGTGKSMTCDALATVYNMPLLRLDFGAIFSSHVGESEQNIRKCLQTAEAISPCILWIDEVEKGISGVASSAQTDGGTTSRVFGTLLTWMQDKDTPVFVVCTANDIFGIPPEFMRAGRFDEIFFLDLPDAEQRAEVIEKLITRKKRDPASVDINAVIGASENYSPAEIEKGIDNALFVAYSDGKRELRTEDIVSELKKFPPLYNSRRDEIAGLRAWAVGEKGEGGRAIRANSTRKTVKASVKNTEAKPVLNRAGTINMDTPEL